MSRTLFVHLGPRKTGTSAIQSALRAHDNSIVIYPKVGLWGDGSHHGLVFSFFGEQRKPRQKDLEKYDLKLLLDRLADEARDNTRNILISSETLAGSGRNFEAFILALLPYLNMTPTDVEILVGCREHFSRAASLFSHRLRGSGEGRNPDEFLRMSAEKLCYERLITKLRRTGFKFTLLNYHPSETWVPRFLEHVGFSERSMPAVKWKNVGFSSKAVVAMLAVSQFARSREDKEKFLRELRNRIPDVHAASQFIFGRDAAAAADRHFSVDRQFIREGFGISLVAQDFQNRQCGLTIGRAEYAELEQITNVLGADGLQILKFARQYCDPSDSTAP